MPDFSLENDARANGYQIVAGVDEAGRGPWAGPVVAAAAILNRDTLPAGLASQLDDSKRLKAVDRVRLLQELEPHAQIGLGVADVEEIDTFNILQATLRAMSRALSSLGTPPDLALIDGNHGPKDTSHPLRCVIKGDSRSLSIAAASIAAKVTRDRIMAELSDRFPGYGWERNAGYGTAEHKDALHRLGVTPQHRHSYKPIVNILRGLAA